MASIAPKELVARIESGTAPRILDVRSRSEFDEGHVPGAMHIPFWQVREHAASIPAAPEDPIIVYCGHGPRAWIAGAALRRRGFTRVTYLRGHMSGWRKADLPLERDPPQSSTTG